jgi:hypothetical protein
MSELNSPSLLHIPSPIPEIVSAGLILPFSYFFAGRVVVGLEFRALCLLGRYLPLELLCSPFKRFI